MPTELWNHTNLLVQSIKGLYFTFSHLELLEIKKQVKINTYIKIIEASTMTCKLQYTLY
jgi:hypothetical protein